jgi:hypothetical protein
VRRLDQGGCVKLSLILPVYNEAKNLRIYSEVKHRPHFIVRKWY